MGTNIVNLPEEWRWLNSISADNATEKALRDGASLLEVLCSEEVIGPDKRVMQSLASLMPKWPSNLQEGFFYSCSFPILTLIWLILWWRKKKKLFFSIESKVITVQSQNSSFFMTRSFCQSRLMTVLTVFVPTCLLTFSLIRCSEWKLG